MPLLAAALIAAGCNGGSADKETDTTAPGEETMAEQQSASEDNFLVPFDGTLTHVHGMGFIEEEGGLYLASHNGLKVYQDDSWFETDGLFNDYMGFNAVNSGFYTSGHPGTDSDLPNPIGIQHSNNGGRSLESLGFEGETDFHLMAAGYRSHDLFVMNPQKNSKMEAGFYISDNEGEDWKQLEPQGLEGELLALAIHPDNSEMMAAAGAAGIFLSTDGGATFDRLTEEGEFGTAVHFTEDALLYASQGFEAVLKTYDLKSKETEAVGLPELTEDGAVYIAVNPANDKEMAFNTVQGHTFVSQTGGESWKQIMNKGQVQ